MYYLTHSNKIYCQTFVFVFLALRLTSLKRGAFHANFRPITGNSCTPLFNIQSATLLELLSPSDDVS